jgi:hypothetical protein
VGVISFEHDITTLIGRHPGESQDPSAPPSQLAQNPSDLSVMDRRGSCRTPPPELWVTAFAGMTAGGWGE